MKLVRANPAYELVAYDRLAAPARELLGDLAAQPSFYGVLRPRDGASRPMLAIDRESATLFLALAEESPLREENASLVARLLFDGALEIRKDGVWISGAAAIEAGGGNEDRDAARTSPRTRIAALSFDALQYAHRLPLPASEIASRLASYNTIPIPRRAQARTFTARGAWRTSSDAQWQTWTRGSASADEATHELYVSPRPEALGDCVEALAAMDATVFRVATTARGQHRPDKLIASFTSLAELRATASSLEAALRGLEPQGVPFSAQLGEGGLLSWSTPRWRKWLLHRLARAVVASRDAGGTAEHAVTRIALDGIDVETWVP